MLRDHFRSLALAAGFAATVLGGSAVSVSAAMPDGAYANLLATTYGRGIVILSYTGATTVNAGVLGLVSSQEYFLRGSSQDCSHMPRPGNKVFRVTGQSDADGVLWLRRSPSIAAAVHSIWLGPTDGSDPAVCAVTLNYQKVELVGDGNRDAVLGIWDKEHVLSLLVRKPDDRARLSIVVDGMAGDDMLTLRGVNRRCGTHPTHSSFVVHFDRPVDFYASRVISITPDEMGKIRSERVIYDAAHHGCANIIGVLIAS